MTIGTRERIKRLEFRLARLEAWLAERAGELPSPASEALPAPATKPAQIPVEEAPSPPEPEIPPPAAAPVVPTARSPRSASKSASARNGWSGPAASRSRSAASSSSAKRSSKAGSGPASRCCSAPLLALALIAAGEWTRRHEILTGVTGLPKAHIPSVLTAAGTAIAYADAYAAYALYGFIGPAVAFVLLGAVALVHARRGAAARTGACRSRPGRRLPHAADRLDRGAELLGALSLSRRGHRRRLRAGPRAGSGAGLPSPRSRRACSGRCRASASFEALTPHAFHIAAGFTLAALLIVSGLLFGPDAAPGEIDPVSSGALAAYLFAVDGARAGHRPRHARAHAVRRPGRRHHRHRLAQRRRARRRARRRHPRRPRLLALVDRLRLFASSACRTGPVPDSLWQPEHYLFGAPLMLGAAFALLFGAAGFLAQGRADRADWSRCCGAPPPCSPRSPSSSRSITASPASSARSPSPPPPCCSPAPFALATEALEQAARAAPRQRRGGSHLRHRRHRRARARAQSSRWRKAGSPSRSL